MLPQTVKLCLSCIITAFLLCVPVDAHASSEAPPPQPTEKSLNVSQKQALEHFGFSSLNEWVNAVWSDAMEPWARARRTGGIYPIGPPRSVAGLPPGLEEPAGVRGTEGKERDNLGGRALSLGQRTFMDYSLLKHEAWQENASYRYHPAVFVLGVSHDDLVAGIRQRTSVEWPLGHLGGRVSLTEYDDFEENPVTYLTASIGDTTNFWKVLWYRFRAPSAGESSIQLFSKPERASIIDTKNDKLIELTGIWLVASPGFFERLVIKKDGYKPCSFSWDKVRDDTLMCDLQRTLDGDHGGKPDQADE